MKKRLLAALLAAVMLFGMVPVLAGAESAPQITGANLTLDSILSLNITTDLAGENAADYAVHVTVGDDTAAQVLTSEDGTYTAKLLAHRMHESVKLELVKATEVKDTKTWTLDGYSTTVKQDYFDEAEMLGLVDALANYGQYADYYADETLDGLVIDAVAAVKAEDLDAYKLRLDTNNASLKATASLYLDEACDLNFKFDAAAMEGKTLYIDGQQQEVSDLGDGRVGYTVGGILPQDYDIMHSVVVKEGEAAVYELSYGVLSYVRQNLQLATELKADLNGLLASMYLYNGTADAYLIAVENAPYEQVAQSLLTLLPTDTTTDALPGGASIANIHSCDWTATAIAEGIELAKYSKLKFYVKTTDSEKYFELCDADGSQTWATSSANWVQVELKYEKVTEDNVAWTLYIDGTWTKGGLNGTTLADIFPKVQLGGTATADVYVTDLLGIPVADAADPYEVIADNLLTVTGHAAGNAPEGFEHSNKLNITWTAEGVPFAEQKLERYKEVKFAIRSIAYHAVKLGGTELNAHSGGAWIQYRFVKNGESWDLYVNGEKKDSVALSDLSDLTFMVGDGNVYYVSEVRALADPDYVDPFASIYANPFTKDGEAATENIPEGYESVTTLSTSWNQYSFKSLDLAPYSQVKFAVKSDGYYGMMPDASNVINETNNGGEWLEIKLVKNDTVWDLYYGEEFQQSLTLVNNNMTDLSFRFGDNSYHVTDLRAMADPNYVDPYALITNKVLGTGEAADNVPDGFVYSNKLNIGWTGDGVAFASQDLAPYMAVKFAIQSVAWHGIGLNGTAVNDHSGNAWIEYLLVKNGESWDFYANGELKTSAALSNLAELTFLTGENDTYYVSELRGIADPDYVPPAEPVYVEISDNPFALTGEETAEESLEGYTTVTTLSTSWNKYSFNSLDLTPYSQVKFAVKSAGYYGMMPDASNVINETNNGGEWLEIKLVKNGDSWNLYYGDTLQQSLTLASNNIADLSFRFGDNTYYVTNIKGIADPDYTPPVYITVSDSIFDIAGTASTETIDGYETITALSISWNTYNFKDFDLTPYSKVKFAVKSSGWYGVMYGGAVINESSGTVEIELIKNGTVWEIYYNGAKQQEVTLANNNLTDLNFLFGSDTYYVSELRAMVDPNYVEPKVGIIEMDPFTLYGTAASDESIEGYSFVTSLTTSWNKYNFIPVDLTNYTEVWFAVKSAGYYGVMPDADNVINETDNSGKWMEIKLARNGAGWDVYYDGTLQRSVTLPNNNLSDLYFRFGSNTYYVTELMGKEDTANPYVSTYVQVTENLINNTPTSTGTENLPSRDVSVINITYGGWSSPGIVSGIKLGDYTELKFWYKVSDTGKWFEMYEDGTAFYLGNATEWTEVKFVPETNGTWTLYENGTGKKWGLTGTTLNDIITTLTLGGSVEADVYVTDMIGIASNTIALVEDGTTEYSIVYENGTGEAFAANELSKYFEAATNLSLETSAYINEVPGKAIVLGAQPAEAAGLSFAELEGPSDYIITNKGTSLYIYGNTEQGTVNGVYAFLAEHFNLDVFYKDTYTIDKLEGDLILDPFTTVGNAKFDYLFSGYGELRSDVTGSGDYAYMMGTVLDYSVVGGGIHNALSLISTEEYGEAHPDWFYTGTTADGYNTGTQLYLAVDNFASGEGTLVSAVADKLYAIIDNKPNMNIFGFSPMDIDIWPTGTGYEKSDELKTQYGTNAAEYILFMNAVAEKLEAMGCREVTLQLLAYNKTLVAPEGLSLHTGTVKVVPYVAPVESNFHMAFTDSRNLVKNPLTGEIDSDSITVADVIEGWNDISSELHLWWYSTDAYSYFMPLNSYDNMGVNYQFAYEHGVKVIFHQSQYDSEVSTDWSRLKIYLQRELAEDPYADVDALIEKFMNAYFGAGAENMKKLMDSQRTWYANLLKNSKQNNGSYWLGTLRGSAFCTQDSGNRKQWTTYQLGTSSTMLTNWMKYINNAKTAINNDSSLTDEQKTELCKRVDLESLPARYVLLKVFGDTTYDASMEAFLQAALTLGVTSQGEGTPIA